MRELKFRAWVKKRKGYRELDQLVFDKQGLEEVWAFPEDDETQQVYYPSEVIIEQYTGLKDKNGKEMYEGDIVRQFDDEEYFVVKFEYGGFLPFTANMLTFDIDYCEVIGNIHENPELVGDKNGE